MSPVSTTGRTPLRLAAAAPADADLVTRFAHRRDEAAFAALVDRHGPLVLGVCRRMLGHTADADDAFQAVFLALARKAGTLRSASLSAWLYGAAFRACLKARRGHARRHALIRNITGRRNATDPLAELSARELTAAIDLELARLPDRLRLPVVLCLVEGMTQREAAARLGWSAGAVKGRLERGRERLRRRLAARGMTLGVAVSAATVGSAPASVPPGLMARATDAALGQSIPASVAELAEAVAPTSSSWRLAIAVMFGLSVAVAAAIGGPGQPDLNPEPEPAKTTPSDPAPRVDLHGDPLPPGALARLGTVRFRAGMWPKLTTASPDGSRIATVGHNHTMCDYLTIWDAADGRPLREVKLPGMEVQSLGWLPGGRGFAIVKVGLTEYVAWEFTDEAAQPPTPINPADVNVQGNDTFTTSVVSPDARLIASGQRAGQAGNEGKLQVWALSPNNQVQSSPTRWERRTPGAVLRVAFTADSKKLIAITQRREPDQSAPAQPGQPIPIIPGKAADKVTISVHDAGSGEELLVFEAPACQERTTTLAPDGKTLYLATRNGRIYAYDLATGKELRVFDGLMAQDQWSSISDLVVTSDGQTLLAVAFGSAIAAFDAQSGKERWRCTEWSATRVNSFSLMPDSKRFVVSSADGAILIGDIATGKFLNHRPGHRGSITAATLIDNGRTVLTTGMPGGWLRWELESGKMIGGLLDLGAPTRFLMGFAPDGCTALGLTTIGNNYTVELYDTTTKRNHTNLALDGSRLHLRMFFGSRPFAWMPDGSIVIVDSDTEAVRFGRDGSVIRKYVAEPGRKVQAVAASPDGKTLVLAGMGARNDFRMGRGWIATYDAQTGSAGKVWNCDVYSFANAAFTLDGKSVVLTGAVSRQIQLEEDPATEVNLASAVILFDPARGGGITPFESLTNNAHFRSTTALAIAPNGHQIAVAEHDFSVTVYEVASGAIRHRFIGHRNQIEQLAFTPDGRRLVSASHDLTALVWDVAPPAPQTKNATDHRRLWEMLTASDAVAAHRVMGELAADPTGTVHFLKSNLKAAVPPTVEEVQRLTTRFGSEAFAEREAATRELHVLGVLAVPAVREVLPGVQSAESRRRLEEFLKQHDRPGKLSGQRLRERRAVELLELIATPDARAFLRDLASGTSPLAADAAAALRRVQ